MKTLLNITCCLFVLQLSFGQNNEVLAESYYKKGAFNKAALIYKNLLKDKPYNTKYLLKLVETYQQLEQYSTAKQLLNTRLTKRRDPVLIIELGYTNQLNDSIDKAKNLYKEAIDYIAKKPIYAYSIARQFENHALLDEAIMAYNKAKALMPDKNFSIQLARIYADQGDIEAMFSNYIDYINFKPQQINDVKRAISDFISEDNTNENNRFFRRALLKKIQQDPYSYWYELLSWLYIQEKAYNKAFIQEKALYKRNPESLERLIELAITTLDDNDHLTATRIFNYIITATQEPSIQLVAHQYLLEIKTKNVNSEPELINIKNNYIALLEQFGTSKLTLSLQMAYAKFLAFTLKDTKTATSFLRKTMTLDCSNSEKAKVKLLLADILVLQERFNEALIFYSQIQLSNKNSTISQEARFKVAKTSYYKGDFDWAEAQLKILKSSTSQLIANDALDLKLLITDNKWEDTTQTALNQYAKADLYAFQNNTEKAINLLDAILNQHKGESIIDQALFKQAQLFEQQQEYKKAAANYHKIIADWKTDILADDAYFHLAELYYKQLEQPETAKTLYEAIIFNFEDSIYFTEARKNYRKLRGDRLYKNN